MEPFALLAAILLVLISLTLPGWLVAWGLGLQGALRAAVAPALSLGIWAGAVWIAIGLQLPWRVWLVLPLVVLVLLPFLWGRLLTLGSHAKAVWPRAPKTALNGGFIAAAAACGIISVVPYLLATRFGQRVAQTWDVVFHLSAIRFTRESGSASPWIAFAPLNHGAAYYPNIYHNIVAFLPGSPLTVYVATTAALLLLWPLMMGVFTLQAMVKLRGATSGSYLASGLAMLGAAMGANFPTNFVANMATPPYTLSLVATPGLVILAVSIYRLRPTKVRYPRSRPDVSSDCSSQETRPVHFPHPWIAKLRRQAAATLFSSQLAPWLALGFLVGLAGIVSTHPASVFNLILLLGGPTAFVVWRAWRQWEAPLLLKTGVMLGTFAVLGLASWFFVAPRLLSMTKFMNPHQNLWTSVWRMLVDYPKGSFNTGFGVSGALLTLAAGFGFALMVRRRRLGWLTTGFVVSWVFFLLASGPVWLGYFLTAPWYLQSARLTPLILMMQLPLAAFALVAGLERLETFVATTNRPRSQSWLTDALVAVLLVSSLGATSWGRYSVIEGAYDPQKIVRGTMLTASEREFIHRQAPTLPDNAVIWGAPFEGTPYWWIIEGKHVVFPSLSWPVPPALDVVRDLADGAISADSCHYLKTIGVTHYYVDTDTTAEGAKYRSYSWLWWDKNVSFGLPDNLLTKVAENPTNPQDLGGFVGQRLYKVNLDACAK